MKHLAWSVLVGLVCFGLVGCGAPAGDTGTDAGAAVSTPEPAAGAGEPAAGAPDSGTVSGEETSSAAPAAGAPGEPVAFRKDGKLMCPLMGSEIASEADAIGYVDFEGTRYFMCCTSCLKAGERDPSMVAQRAREL